MSTPDLANIEAVCNVAANLGEIAGIAAGLRYLIGSTILWATKYPGARQWALFGILAAIGGLALPGIVNLAVTVNPIFAAVVGWILCIPLVVFAVMVFFKPYTIALKRKAPLGGLILFLVTASVLLVPLWYVAVWMATKKLHGDLADKSAEPPDHVPPASP